MRIAGILLVVLLFSGCFQLRMLPYMDQGLTLKELSAEKDGQNKDVAQNDARFDKLLAAAVSGDIKNYTTEAQVMAAFGPPILSTTMDDNGNQVKQSLYRYGIQSRGPHKIYFIYNREGRVIRYESL